MNPELTELSDDNRANKTDACRGSSGIPVKMNEEQIIGLINSAFGTVPMPEKDSITGCTCRECMEIREDFTGKHPEELEADRMLYHSWDMGFFTPEARQYYLPGWMRLGITQPSASYSDAVVRTLGYGKGWDPPGGYTEVQRQAIFEFMKFFKIRGNYGDDMDFDIAWDEWATGSGSDLPGEESE